MTNNQLQKKKEHQREGILTGGDEEKAAAKSETALVTVAKRNVKTSTRITQTRKTAGMARDGASTNVGSTSIDKRGDAILQRGDRSTLRMSLGGGGNAAAAAATASLRRMSELILLLRHASKCLYEEGSCPITRKCGAAKNLWNHIRDCKDKTCPVKHCIYSRDLLIHYHRCCDRWCVICIPVRQAILRAQAKSQAAPAGGNRKPLAAETNGSDVGRAEKEGAGTRKKGEDAEQEKKQQANTDDSGGRADLIKAISTVSGFESFSAEFASNPKEALKKVIATIDPQQQHLLDDK